MAERLFSHEVAAGGARPPTKPDDICSKDSMAKLEEAAAKYRNKITSMGNPELKTLAKEKGVEVGNKTDMIDALMALFTTSSSQAARKKELKTTSKEALKELVVSRGLDAAGKE